MVAKGSFEPMQVVSLQMTDWFKASKQVAPNRWEKSVRRCKMLPMLPKTRTVGWQLRVNEIVL